MRDWNRCSVILCLLLAHISTLPMRDWNLDNRGLQSFFVIHISTLPMRDWNPTTIATKERPFANFHSTYERLKLCIDRNNCNFIINISTLPMRDWNFIAGWSGVQTWNHFHSTYERLKLIQSWKWSNQIKYFHSTYERLKHLWNGW